ncbi:hypothetical protein N9N67_04620 [Bacteriovoracaceae bacterium]|nr:hypothetical protein [Bacteriovoracaceae bacterium]
MKMIYLLLITLFISQTSLTQEQEKVDPYSYDGMMLFIEEILGNKSIGPAVSGGNRDFRMEGNGFEVTVKFNPNNRARSEIEFMVKRVDTNELTQILINDDQVKKISYWTSERTGKFRYSLDYKRSCTEKKMIQYEMLNYFLYNHCEMLTQIENAK